MVDLLKFKNFDEFISKRKKLRVYYILLTYKQKRELKKYIYNLNYKKYILDIIWCYLNEPKSSPYYVYDYEIREYARCYARNKDSIKL